MYESTIAMSLSALLFATNICTEKENDLSVHTVNVLSSVRADA